MMKIINPNDLEFKKSSGKEKVRCPECDAQRSDKKDKSLLYNHDEKYGKCFYCEALVFEPREEKIEKFEVPNQEVKTEYSDKMIKYAKDRGISEDTLRKFFVTEEKYYQPAEGKEVNNIVFNYYYWDKLVNKKYRSPKKQFTQTTNAKSIFYNLNATIGQEEVIIVEGEFDVLAMYEAGFKNVISVPNGANNNDNYWQNSKEFLSKVNSFIIAVDNDDKGREVQENIAQRLGRYKCKFVEWTQKDANDELLHGDIEKCLKNAKKFPVTGVLSVSDLWDEVLNLYKNGLPDTIKPKQARWEKVNDVFSTMFGQLTVITGIPSHGKSSVVDDYILSLCNDHNYKASWFSPEHNPRAIHISNFSRKVIGKRFWGKDKMSVQELEQFKDWSNEKIYIVAQDEQEPTWDWLLNKMQEQIYAYGINIFCIDAFNKVILPDATKNGIDQQLTRLTAFCIRNNVSCYLVAHPTKMKKKDNGSYEIPTLYDVSGSSDFYNQTHNGITVYRIFGDEIQEPETVFINTKTKFDFQGKIAEHVSLKYHEPSTRFYSNGIEPNYSYLKEEQEQIAFEKPKQDESYSSFKGNGLDDFEGGNSKDAPF